MQSQLLSVVGMPAGRAVLTLPRAESVHWMPNNIIGTSDIDGWRNQVIGTSMIMAYLIKHNILPKDILEQQVHADTCSHAFPFRLMKSGSFRAFCLPISWLCFLAPAFTPPKRLSCSPFEPLGHHLVFSQCPRTSSFTQLERQELYFSGCHPIGFKALINRWRVCPDARVSPPCPALPCSALLCPPLPASVAIPNQHGGITPPPLFFCASIQVMLFRDNVGGWEPWYDQAHAWRLTWLQRHDGLWDPCTCFLKARPPAASSFALLLGLGLLLGLVGQPP